MDKEKKILVIGITVIIFLNCVLAVMILTENNIETLNETQNTTNDSINRTLNQTSNDTTNNTITKTPKVTKSEEKSNSFMKGDKIITIEDGRDYILMPGDPGYEEKKRELKG